MDADDLTRIAKEIAGRLVVVCPTCLGWQRLGVDNRGLGLGSSGDPTSKNPRGRGRPQLQFFCPVCRVNIGFITADVDDEGDEPEGTRWERLEL